MINCVMVDDEPLAREILAGFLARTGLAEVRADFRDAEQAIAHLSSHPVDLLFLDIEMPGMTGITLLQSLQNPPVTILTTAYRDYALEGYELGVIDFLLKPFSYDRFRQAFDRAVDLLALKSQNQLLEKEQPKADHLYVKSGITRLKLYFSDITHIQGWKDYAIIHAAGKKIVVKGSVKSMEMLFRGNRFIRVHKSFIVARDRISRIDKNKIIMDKHEIPIGRSYKGNIESLL